MTMTPKMSTICSRTFLLSLESSGDHHRSSDHKRGQKTTHAVHICETNQFSVIQKKYKTCHASAFDHQIRVLIHCHSSINGFFTGRGYKLRMCKHHPDRVESDAKEMVCKEHGGLSNTGQKRNRTIDAFAPTFEILDASRSECGQVIICERTVNHQYFSEVILDTNFRHSKGHTKLRLRY